MRKVFLGAGAALALIASNTKAQSPAQQAPAPVVSLDAEPLSKPSSRGNISRTQALEAMPGGVGAPVVSLEGTPVAAPLGGDVLSSSAVGGSSGRSYAEVSYLLMFVNDLGLAAPLLTSGPSNGILGRPGTTVLAGQQDLEYDSAHGVRVALGGFLGESRMGFETVGTYIGRISETQNFPRSNTVLYARPFFDTTSRLENARALNVPGAFSGSMTIDTAFQAWGLEANPFIRVAQSDFVTFDLLAGFRFFQATESLNIYDSTTLQAGGVSAWNGIGVAAPATIVVHDHIGARNNFYGGQVGAKLSFGRGGLFLDLGGKVALGSVQQVVNVDGSTSLTQGSLISTGTTPGGFLASGTNLGQRTSNKFATLSEGNVTLGYQLTSFANIFAGYTVIYLSDMARPGDQINRNVTLNLLPTSSNYNNRRPTNVSLPQIVENDMWIHGFNFGVTLSY